MKPTQHLMKWLFFLSLWTLSISFTSAQMVKGADISWQTQQEASGYKWYDDSGYSTSLHNILKQHSMTAIRLRVWVNPSGGWCNQADVVKKAQWAKSAGMDVMIDFHYSDTWADPGNQAPPAAWKNYNINQMMTAVYNHTVAVLTAVKNAGVTPKWVQIGNETNDGMLWPLGKASTNGFKNYAWLINTGNNAAKSVFPSIKTIVHIANGDNLTVLQWNLDGLKAQGATYDIIGLSLYPGSSWQSAADAYTYNITNLKSRYGKSTMLCEVGMSASPIQTAYDALKYILDKSKANGSLGVFYWEPQGYNNWSGYTKHCWLSNGRPTYALDAFQYGGNRLIEELSEESLQELSLNLFPNPFVNELKVSVPSDYQQAVIKLYDTAGRQIMMQELTTGETHTLNLSHLKSGIYVARISGGEQELTHKIIKQ